MGKLGRQRPFAFPAGVYDSARQRKKWFWQGLQQIATMKQRPKSLAFADQIGCQHGGGQWADYLAMIREFADHNPNIRVWLVQYDPEASSPLPPGNLEACPTEASPQEDIWWQCPHGAIKVRGEGMEAPQGYFMDDALTIPMPRCVRPRCITCCKEMYEEMRDLL